MTILTKPSIIIKKPDVTESPLVHDNVCDEEKIDVPPVAWSPPKRSSGGLFCMSITAFVMAITGFTCGLMLYRQYLRTNAVHRYQGFCSIPMEPKQEAQIRWHTDPDVQVFSTLDADLTENALRERLDIGDEFEKIVVIDNGREVEFIHDFNVNLTGIVDEARCFMMQLDRSLVLPPARLVLGLEAGESFDVSRVRTSLRAAPAPPAAALALLPAACRARPLYTLRATGDLLIRKRSAEDPPHNFIQFSGKHVQEIEINNMAEILEYERTHGLSAGQ